MTPGQATIAMGAVLGFAFLVTIAAAVRRWWCGPTWSRLEDVLHELKMANEWNRRRETREGMPTELSKLMGRKP